MKNIPFCITLTALIILFSIPGYCNHQDTESLLPFLTVDGNRFVDEDGNEVILRGRIIPRSTPVGRGGTME